MTSQLSKQLEHSTQIDARGFAEIFEEMRGSGNMGKLEKSGKLR
jgi:hypothetical protein